MPAGTDFATLLGHKKKTILHEASGILYDSSGTDSVRDKLDSVGTKTVVTGENISALKVLRGDISGDVFVANSSDVNDAARILGLSVSAGGTGADIILRSSGEHVDLSWNWDTTKPIFFNASGTLTQVPPSTGFVMIFAVAESPTKIKIEPAQAVLL